MSGDQENHIHISAEERAEMFIAWCALRGFGVDGWPHGAFEQLVSHIAAGGNAPEGAN
jgi:hypothetical protein